MQAKTHLLALLPLLLLTALASQVVAQEPPMVKLTDHPARDWHPTWSPDGTQIAFMSDRNVTSQDIWIVPATGGQAVRLPADIVSPTMDAPTWSPNGDLIAFHSRIPVCFCYIVWAVNASGGSSESITSCCGPSTFNPSWSPDGSRIVFDSDRSGGGSSNIFIVAASGEPPDATQITFEPDHNTDPAWSPDNSQIVFVSRIEANMDLWLVPPTGGPATQLTNYPGVELLPAWSPDGTRIAFTRGIDNQDDIYVLPAAGGQLTQLTTHPGDDSYPVWSPDGTKIAFTSNRSGNDEIWVMDLSTTAVELAPVAPAQVRLLASPNPFQDATTIRLVGMEGGGILRVVDVAGRLVREIGVPIAPPSVTPTLVWDGRNGSGLPVAPGTYFLTFESGNHRATGRLVRDR